MIRGLGTLYTWNVWSPRLGVTMKLTEDGRTILRASYGRFHQGVLTGELSPFHPAASSTTTTAWNATTGGYTTPVSVVNPRRNLLLDADMRTPRTDEYRLASIESSGAVWRWRSPTFARTAAISSGGPISAAVYREETRVLPDGGTLPVQVLTSPTADRRFLLTNPEDYALAYNGLVLALEKRHSSGWQAFGSYTWSRASGLQVSSAATASRRRSARLLARRT